MKAGSPNRMISRLGRFGAHVVSTVAVGLLCVAPAHAQDGQDDGIAKLKQVVEESLQELGDKAPTPKGEAAKDQKKEPSPEERAQRGVVTIERGGQILGLGAVLAGDGRVLTALSPLGSGTDLDARFADGSVVKVKLGHHDRAWDLALLVPQTGKWPEGLTASSKDPIRPDASLRGFTVRGGKAAPTQMVVRSRKDLVGGDDKRLENALEIGSRVTPTDLGSPIVDEEGRVVGVLGRGCAPNEGRPCTPVAFGVPIAPIKSFLRTVPSTAVAPAAWLGIQGVTEVGAVAKGVRVLMVHPESPAEEARLKGGDKSISDVILAVDGVPVTSPEMLADVIKKHAVGEKVPLLVFGQGKYRTVTVALRGVPDASAPKSSAPEAAELPPSSEPLPRRPPPLPPPPRSPR